MRWKGWRGRSGGPSNPFRPFGLLKEVVTFSVKRQPFQSFQARLHCFFSPAAGPKMEGPEGSERLFYSFFSSQ